MNTLVLLNFSNNSVHFVQVSDEQTGLLAKSYDNDVESWATDLFSDDIGIDLGNCHWMLVDGNPEVFFHRKCNDIWKYWLFEVSV